MRLGVLFLKPCFLNQLDGRSLSPKVDLVPLIAPTDPNENLHLHSYLCRLPGHWLLGGGIETISTGGSKNHYIDSRASSFGATGNPIRTNCGG